jgi:hypothetical protein
MGFRISASASVVQPLEVDFVTTNIPPNDAPVTDGQLVTFLDTTTARLGFRAVSLTWNLLETPDTNLLWAIFETAPSGRVWVEYFEPRLGTWLTTSAVILEPTWDGILGNFHQNFQLHFTKLGVHQYKYNGGHLYGFPFLGNYYKYGGSNS